MKRIGAIDITRGIVMVIMALDHVRDLMHVDALQQSPTNLETTTPLLFFTRWITHLCAPAFVFLAGTSVFLSYNKSKSVSTIRLFLLKRGFYLIVLEFLVVNLLLFFDVGYHTLLFEVIAAIGFGFIIMALLLKASPTFIGIMGLIILFCHNLFPLLPLPDNTPLQTILSFLFTTTAAPLSANRVFVMAYPPVPWLSIMMLGFAAGPFFKTEALKRRWLFLRLGIAAILLFLLFRFINIYGDPQPWSVQKSGVYTFLSFMNVTKYPPSLQFSLVTLGVMCLMLALSEGVNNKLSRVVAVYGQVPLFYFLVHFLVIHLLLLLLLFLQGFTWAQLEFTSGTFGRPRNLQSGLPLWAIYIVWIGVVALLYKPCQWYGKYKAEHPYGWLKYL